MPILVLLIFLEHFKETLYILSSKNRDFDEKMTFNGLSK
jgi:hypothetical protein